MSQEVGIYRGSFDPPHLGHLEAVTCSLKHGMTKIVLVYKDSNPFKPFRSNDADRKAMLVEMFKGMDTVVISEFGYKAVLETLLCDLSIKKVYRIVGSDFFGQTPKTNNVLQKVESFVIPREDHPIPTSLEAWKGIPMQIIPSDVLTEQTHSSTKIRQFYHDRRVDYETLPLPKNLRDLILKKGLYQLTDTEFANRSLLEELKEIIENEIGKHQWILPELHPLSIHFTNDMGLSGLSGDLVCFVMDKDNHAHFAMKIFRGSKQKSNYESESMGFRTIAQLKLQNVVVPEILFSFKKEQFFLIAMRMAKGKPLIDLLDSEEAVRLCARTCLQLHQTNRRKISKIEDGQLAIFEEGALKVIQRLEKGQGNFLIVTPDQLKECWRKLRESFKANPGFLSYTHGDPNPGNWIVDLNAKLVTYIDLSLFSRSVSGGGDPYGFAMNELFEAVSSFRIVGERLGLSKAAIFKLQHDFKNEYDAFAPSDITTQEAISFFETYWLLRDINYLFKKLEIAQEPELKELQNEIADKFSKII